MLLVVRYLWPKLPTPFEHRLGIEGRIAAENLSRTVERSGVAVAAIALSIAIAVAASSLAGSFRSSIVHWYALIGDVVVAARRTQGWVAVPVSGDLAETLARVPGVLRVDTLRIAQGQLYDDARIAVVGLSDGFIDEAPDHGARFGGRSVPRALETLKQGRGVLVSENFVTHFGARVGDDLDVPSPRGGIRLPVVGVIPDYTSDRGSIILSHDLYREQWGDPLVNYIMLTAAPKTPIDDLRLNVGTALGSMQQLGVLETRELTQQLDDAVANAFADMDAIQFLVLVITLAGIADLVISNALDRRRELAVWEAIGAYDTAVVKSLVWEALTIATVAIVAGVLVGLATSWVWIRFSYPALVGYVLEFRFAWETAVTCMGLGLGAAALAGGLAGYLSTRRPVLEGLRYE